MKTAIFKIFLMALLTLVSVVINAQEVKEIIGIGAAKGAPGKARELALARALKDAVMKGAGVDLYSESKVENFKLEYDRVISSSFGYIQEYKVIAQDYDPKRGYAVKLKAKVGKGRPNMDQVLALRLLNKRMKSPRVIIECVEKIDGVDADPPVSQAILGEMAQKTGFELISNKTLSERNKKDSIRESLLGNVNNSKARKAGLASTSDFKIISKINGSVGSLREPFPDVKVRDVALGINLTAVWTDTGEVIATVSLPTFTCKGEGNMELPFEMKEQLVRYWLGQTLKKGDSDGAYKLYRKIVAKWTAELDLGAKIILEFKKINKPAFDKLIEVLRQQEDISYVWRRDFDKDFFSVLEVETRLTSKQLEDIVLKVLGRKCSLETATKKRLLFSYHK